MKMFTLSLLATVFLFSCQEDASQNSANEIIYKKSTGRRVNLDDNSPLGGNGQENSQVVTQQVPFDLGLSAVLGAGALAAIRTARKRRLAEK